MKKLIEQLHMRSYLKKKSKYAQLMFYNIIQLVKKIVLWMIPYEKDCYDFAVTKCSSLLRRIWSKHHDDFYCLDILHFFPTENVLKFHEKLYENKDFCGFVFPTQKNNILEFNQ